MEPFYDIQIYKHYLCFSFSKYSLCIYTCVACCVCPVNKDRLNTFYVWVAFKNFRISNYFLLYCMFNFRELVRKDTF